MSLKIHQFIGILVLGLSLLTACRVAPVSPTTSSTQPAPGKTTTELISLNVGTLPFLSNAILQIAQEEGYFAEQGLQVALITQQSSTEFIPLLLQGELDVATPALNAGFFNAVAGGGKIKMALPLTNFTVQDCASIGILARQVDVEAKTYATTAQWKGAKITPSSSAMQTTAHYVIDQALRQSGGTVQDVEMTIVDPPAQAEALLSGQTDLIYAIEPRITQMTTDPAIALLMPAEPFAPDLTSSMIVFGAKLLDDPALGERFATAYLKAVRQYSQGKTPRNVALVAAYTKLEPTLVEKMCWPVTALDGAVNIDSIMAYQVWLQEQDAIDRLVTPDEFLDTRFAEVAYKTLGEVAP